jgi:hypothetical protein
MGRLIASLVLMAGLLLASAPAVLAAGPVTFGKPTATSDFGKEILFRQPTVVNEPIASAELLLTFPGALGPTILEVEAPHGTGERLLTESFDPVVDGALSPNTTLEARWRLYPSASPDAPVTGPLVTVKYVDDRFDWRTASGDIVRVHWYEGTAAFGARALKIAEEAVESSSALLGVTETEPIDFFVYADVDPFYDALGPGTRENVGGQANAEIRTLFALVTPGEIDDAWVSIVIPHELTHLVFDTAVENPYHFPPRWLNEGVAEYQSQGYDTGYRQTIESGARNGTLIPLDGLTGQFPTTYERFSLAYAESTAAVDYLVRTYGQDALVTLITSYASGLTDDEAFQQALGLDTTAFGDAWLASVGAVAPTRYGPQPAAAGPIPAPWVGDPAPGTTAAPGAPTAAPSGSPVPTSAGTTESAGASIVTIVAILATIVAVIGLAVRRRRQDAAGT